MPTARLHWTAYLWPGLPQLWTRGSWVGLVVAVGFTALANVLLLATFVYSEWIPSDAISIGYGSLVTVWLIAWWQSRWERRANLADAAGEEIPESPASVKKRNEQDKLFREAQQRYLESDWLGAEQLLLKLLKADARDIEGRLMLATLWRHQGRRQEALRQLDKLERLEAAQDWQREIAAERSRLETEQTDILEANTEPTPETPTSETLTTETETTTESPNKRMAA